MQMSVPMSNRSEFNSTVPSNRLCCDSSVTEIFLFCLLVFCLFSFYPPHAAGYTLFNHSIAITFLPYLPLSQNLHLGKVTRVQS